MLRTYWTLGLSVSAAVYMGGSVFAAAPTYTYQYKIPVKILSCPNSTTQKGGKPSTPDTYAFCEQLKTSNSQGGPSTDGWYKSDAANVLQVEQHLAQYHTLDTPTYLCPLYTFSVAYPSSSTSNGTFFTQKISGEYIPTTWMETAAPSGCGSQQPVSQSIPSKTTKRSAYVAGTIGHTITCSSDTAPITYAWCMQPPTSLPAPSGFDFHTGWYPAKPATSYNMNICPLNSQSQHLAPAEWDANKAMAVSAPYYVSNNANSAWPWQALSSQPSGCEGQVATPTPTRVTS